MSGIYVHVPFCLRKCRYCGFTSYPYHSEQVNLYLRALEKEMKEMAPVFTSSVGSIYLGGGTPTCLVPGDLAGILTGLGRFFHIRQDVEITVEANPDTLNGAYLELLEKSGVNRLSLGLQAVQKNLLSLLGRSSSAGACRRALQDARRAGFTNINIDVIFGLPGQTLRDWQKTLRFVLDLEPEHVSAYSLELVPGTVLARMVEGGSLSPCQEELEADMFEEVISTLTAAGFEHYEISNFARPGRACRHNLVYWKNGDYLGLGPAAHSHLQGQRRANPDDLPAYFAGTGRVNEEKEARREMADTVLMGLRLLEGLDLDVFCNRFGLSLQDAYGPELERLIKWGLLELAGSRVRLTHRGLFLANEVFMAFV